MGLYKDTGGGHFTITYGGREMPFAGLDPANTPPTEIRPDAFVALQNCTINEDTLDFTTWLQNPIVSYSGTFIGFGDLAGQFFLVLYTATPSPNLTIISVPSFPAFSSTTIVGVIYLPDGVITSPPVYGSLTYKNINGVCFFSFPGVPYIFQHNNINASVLTVYLVAAYLAELNGRLVVGDVFQYVIPP